MTDRTGLVSLVKELAKGDASPELRQDQFRLVAAEAAGNVLVDLYRQGWAVRLGINSRIEVCSPKQLDVADHEKRRVQEQELLQRDEQLRKPTVERFIRRMETPREHEGQLVSILNLMRDGRELADSLRNLRLVEGSSNDVRSVIDPYLQIIHPTERDQITGLKLMDVWRYFRHTWSNPYTTVPGRTMLLLIRDRAVDNHPVIGIAALSSPIVQLDERDRWIGWRPQDVLADIASKPTLAHARWLVSRLEKRRCEIYVDDLISDELFWPGLWDAPTSEAEVALRKEAKIRRIDHQRLSRRAYLDAFDRDHPDFWIHRAESDLYRSKRCLLLADLMRDKAALIEFLYPSPCAEGLRRALEDRNARLAIRAIARRAKADSIGTEVADLTVCGAIAPYREVIGGKLITMLTMSPTVVSTYRRKYQQNESEIASSIAGRSISRASKLAYIGTTSLYGTTSSQYNRVRIPAEVLDAKADIRLERLGRSKSYGTSHLSTETVKALVRLSELTRIGARINSLFGEGVNPKLRKVRAGFDALGWPSDELLQHGRQRIIYGVSLVENLRPYLLGMNSQPRYLIKTTLSNDIQRIADWWGNRWLLPRIQSDEVLERVALHTVERPIQHGARVPLPGPTET